ncbi:hypothetical protein LUZ63_000193 [Rhynchospora breviuscula]|uniref:WAT1-related protein n=1 Tax=Rhynchospora breviuscula TaxID=2022672 RepID=A0A9Q0CVR7_9POAL|nr:hypothetical protein LUZ63_000193 [Rhynchospora breviuscula]
MEEYKPMAAMVTAQCIYAVMNMLGKAALNSGFSPLVFVVYKLTIATLFLIPTLFLAKGGRVTAMSINLKGFCLVFLAALAGGTLNKFLYYIGLNLGDTSMASSICNLIPAITFVMAASVGLERVELRSLRSWTKIIGTIVCVGGAMILTFFKGPRILNSTQYPLNWEKYFDPTGYKWILGALCQLGSASTYSLWLILQAPICAYVDPLAQTVWFCLLSSVQSATVVFFVEPNMSAWIITSVTQLSACLFAGIFASGVCFYLQSWCISVRGPVYCAMFSPLSTVITIILASVTLHEELHLGSLIGAVAIIGGLYVVLWGKTEDLKHAKEDYGGYIQCQTSASS